MPRAHRVAPYFDRWRHGVHYGAMPGCTLKGNYQNSKKFGEVIIICACMKEVKEKQQCVEMSTCSFGSIAIKFL